jgi:hypothetical protein
MQNCQSQFMIAQDERLILNSMKIIKLQSWEEKFKNLVESLRDKKFVWLSKLLIHFFIGCLLQLFLRLFSLDVLLPGLLH